LRISIITVSYNAKNTIEKSLKSIENQSYNNIEHIIIDGGSKDNTLEICNSFPHVSKIISEPDKGVYDAFNKGLKLATGAVESKSETLDQVINEIAITRTTERGSRADDKRGETAMEDRKKQGYF